MDGEQLMRKDLIKKERAVRISFRKRKKNLLKKGYELATLCGIDLCVIIFDPKQGDKHVKPETWPVDPHEVKQIIKKYKQKQQEKRDFRIPCNPGSKLKKVVAQLTDLRKRIFEDKYPPCYDSINSYSEDELKLLLGRLDTKLKAANDKINMLKETQIAMQTHASQVLDRVGLFRETRNVGDTSQNYEQRNHGNGYSSVQQSILDVIQAPNYFQDGYQGYPPMLPFNPHYGVNWPLTMSNNPRNSTNAGAAPSYDIQFPQLSTPMCFGPAPWKWEDVMCNNVNPWSSYFAPAGQQMPPPFSQYSMIFGDPPQMHIPQNNETIDFLQMKNRDASN